MGRGRKCCMPGCSSNYSSQDVYTPAFQFPKDEDRRKLWIQSVKRKNFTPSKTAVVCVLHFEEKFIIREDRVTRDDGTLLVVQRKKLSLTKDAFPTKLPNCPAYLSTELPTSRPSPSKRCAAQLARDEENFKKWSQDDIILSLGDLTSKFNLPVGWHSLILSDYVLFYTIDASKCPKIAMSFKIFDDLSVEIWHTNYKVPQKSFQWLLGNELKCDRWTKFDCLFSKLSTYNIEEQSLTDKVSVAAQILESCITDEDCTESLPFLEEQIRLFSMKQIRYSPSLIVWSARLFYSFSAAYIMLRDSKVLTLPHPSYLKKLSATLNVSGTNSHIGYLKKKSGLLKPHEKVVNVLLDEIYISPSLDYKGGDVVGAAENVDARVETATTIQTYMIISPFCNNKDVVALFPVKNLTAQKLYAYTREVLKVLFECGYSTLCLISDNNRINRNMFILLCYDGKLEQADSNSEGIEQPPKKSAKKKKPKPELQHSIPNPFNKEETLFFLFDTPHLIKSVRNNWVNQHTAKESFFYPDPETYDVCQASMEDLKKLHEREKFSVMKLAPKLSRKVLSPSTFERQTVLFAVNLFHETNAVALALNKETNSKGTQTFIELINKWWKICNVKKHDKGIAKNDVFCDPVFNDKDERVKFLEYFNLWMKEWGRLRTLKPSEKKMKGIPTKGGFLSCETQFSLQFTTETLIELTTYVFSKYAPKYLLLGKFQTDSLEGRFGQYRQMSGGNYNLSCRQVLESEHKLKVLGLLKFQSEKVGHFNLQDFQCDETEESKDVEIPEEFYEVFNSFDDIEIDNSTMSVLIYVAGYISYQVSSKLSCETCVSKLVLEKQLEYELLDCDANKYLSMSSRGALKWPRKCIINIIVCVYTIFTKLISYKYEKHFIDYKKQKNLVVAICYEKLDLLGIITNAICGCQMKSSIIVKRCLSVAANIMLNNYTKMFNDVKVSKKKRKLATVSN